ncbi:MULTISPECIES: DciA family protein [unclassified Streptomyces]|uniref:DciA family protein n=1 Tax=unclassified Streptomyces TaxID=2593676 RepID=UPI0004BDAC1D|nr:MULTISPECIES: DciA family protein [unclassified Streptomyces]
MTEVHTPENQPDSAPELSGADLARIALNQARQAAKQRGASEARAPRRHRANPVRRDGREPSGFAAVLQALMTDRAWELPAAGGTVLERWPDIAAAIAPQLPDHVQAVTFHPETGQLDLLPESPAYATQLRLISAHLITAANETTGTGTVRTIRVLPPGTAPASQPARPASPPSAPTTPQTPPKAPETPTDGYREAIAAHRATWNTTRHHTNPKIQKAAERQLRERLREPVENFADGRQALADLHAKAAAQQQVRPSDASRARALQRLAAERAGLATIAPATAASQRLDRTA